VSRTPLVLSLAAAAVAALAGCSAAPAPAPAPAPATPAAPAAAPAGDTTAACSGVVAMDAVVITYPGADPDAPPAAPDALKQWSASVMPPFGTVAANVPAELDPAVSTLRTAIDATAQGTPIAADDATTTEAGNAIDRWAHDTCGFTHLDVTGNGKDLPGVPATLPVGPVALSFGNGGDPATGGFVLLLAKVKDGASYSLDGIRDGSVDFTSVADVVAAVQPGAGSPTGYGTAQLTAGKYLVVSPIGAPPAFTATVATDLEVG
jgi:hypothetical protein